MANAGYIMQHAGGAIDALITAKGTFEERMQKANAFHLVRLIPLPGDWTPPEYEADLTRLLDITRKHSRDGTMSVFGEDEVNEISTLLTRLYAKSYLEVFMPRPKG